jgi:hypothetical protein
VGECLCPNLNALRDVAGCLFSSCNSTEQYGKSRRSCKICYEVCQRREDADLNSCFPSKSTTLRGVSNPVTKPAIEHCGCRYIRNCAFVYWVKAIL